MKSFEEHLRGAKAHNREDKIWLVTCFSEKMAKLCAKYGFPDDEDMFVYLIEHFLRDLDRFVIYDDDHTVHSGGNGSGNR